MNISEKMGKCNLCNNRENKCTEEKRKKTGFCISLFTNFTSEFLEIKFDDLLLSYINGQSVIF